MQGPPTRLKYFTGRLLTAEDLEGEQQYHLQKRRLLNQHLHGQGVVGGLLVTPTDPPRSGCVSVQPGLALDGWGREIVVCEAVELDLTSCLGAEALRAKPKDQPLYITLEYEETEVDPIPVPDLEDPCSATTQPSRVVEGYRLSVRGKPVARQDAPSGELLERIRELVRQGGNDEALRRLLVEFVSEPSPTSPRDPALTLAAVRSTSGPISEERIDNASHRSIVISMRVAQALFGLALSPARPSR